MPLFATLVGSIATGLTGFFSTFLTYQLALKFAAYTTWVVVAGTFLAAVYTCTSALYTGAVAMAVSGGINGGILSAFFMGLGMLIPSNAGAVLGCVSSVWIATSIYKVQKQGIFNFAK